MGPNISEEVAGTLFRVAELNQRVQAMCTIENRGYKHRTEAQWPRKGCFLKGGNWRNVREWKEVKENSKKKRENGRVRKSKQRWKLPMDLYVTWVKETRSFLPSFYTSCFSSLQNRAFFSALISAFFFLITPGLNPFFPILHMHYFLSAVYFF
jgi:hypothetical protein